MDGGSRAVDRDREVVKLVPAWEGLGFEREVANVVKTERLESLKETYSAHHWLIWKLPYTPGSVPLMSHS